MARVIDAKMRKIYWPLCLSILLSAALCACADDSAIQGVGGAVEMLHASHPTIRMAREVVKIDRLPEGRVDAVFVFRNEGPATDVLIGFPGFAGGDSGQPELLNFRSYVDGKRVHVAVKKGARSDETEETRLWYVKKVHFGAWQTHVIEDRYQGGGGDDSIGDRWFEYILHTGASWKGPIGRAQIICDLRGLRQFAPYSVDMPEYRIKGSFAICDLRNIKPTEMDDIHLGWFPAFRNVLINGQFAGMASLSPDQRAQIANRPEAVGRGALPPDLCVRTRLRGNDVILPGEVIADWLGPACEYRKVGAGRYRIYLGNRWAEFRTGSRDVASSTGKTLRMRYPASLQSAAKFGYGGDVVDVVSLKTIARALGGKAVWDAKRNRMLVSCDLKSAPFMKPARQRDDPRPSRW